MELLYVGQTGGLEAKIVAARGLAFAGISAGKFRRDHFAGRLEKVLNLQTIGPNVRDALRTVQGCVEAWRLLRQWRPAVVFLKGGFVCVPVGVAAKVLGIPYVIHESDVSPGLANRLLGRWATKVAVGFPVKSYHDFDRAKLVFVGNPVRTELLKPHRLEGLAEFGLEATMPVLFVTGGSGGAAQINDAILAALPELLEFCQVIHLAGEGDYERVKFEVRRKGKVAHIERYHLYGFLLAEMAKALAAADVVVSRAGANTIAELAVLGKPTILIPNYQMAGHQVENARVLSRTGAVRVLDGQHLTTARLVGEIRKILDDPEEQARLEKGIRQFGNLEAAKSLAEVILGVGQASEQGRVQKPNTGGDDPTGDRA